MPGTRSSEGRADLRLIWRTLRENPPAHGCCTRHVTNLLLTSCPRQDDMRATKIAERPPALRRVPPMSAFGFFDQVLVLGSLTGLLDACFPEDALPPRTCRRSPNLRYPHAEGMPAI